MSRSRWYGLIATLLLTLVASGCPTADAADDDAADDDDGDDDDDDDDDDDAADDDDDAADDDTDDDDDDCGPFVACADSPTVSDGDGNVYDTVDLCGACWMAENLDVGTMMGVHPLDGPLGNLQSDDGVIQKFCMDNNASSCAANGGLYQWREAMAHDNGDPAGICPGGWHIPSDDEWKALEIALGMDAADADEQSAWRGTDQGAQLMAGGAANFDAPLGGYVGPVMGGYYDFINDGSSCGFWTSTRASNNAWYRGLHEDHGEIYRALYSQTEEALSVRCVRD